MTMIKYKIHRFFIFAFAVIVFTNCSDNKENISHSVNKHLIFDNYDELLEVTEKTRSMNLEELNEWKKKKQFNSPVIEALNRYYSFNFETAISEQDILSFVNNNSKYLQLIEKDGDTYLETIFHNNKNRFILNSDYLFQVGDKVHKIFANGEIIANIDQIDYLKNLSEFEFSELMKNDDVSKDMTIIQRDLGENQVINNRYNNCPREDEGRATSDNQRTLVSVKLDDITNFTGPDHKYEIYSFVRPYKKTFGIWYHASRTITWSKDYTVYLAAGSYLGQSLYSVDVGPFTTSSPQYKVESTHTITIPNNNGQNLTQWYEFENFHFMGDTPSTNPAIISCN